MTIYECLDNLYMNVANTDEKWEEVDEYEFYTSETENEEFFMEDEEFFIEGVEEYGD